MLAHVGRCLVEVLLLLLLVAGFLDLVQGHVEHSHASFDSVLRELLCSLQWGSPWRILGISFPSLAVAQLRVLL